MITADGAFLAEAIRLSPDGTLSALAVFDVVTAPAVPAQISFACAVHVRSNDTNDAGVHTIRLDVVTPQGESYRSVEIVVPIGPFNFGGSGRWAVARFHQLDLGTHGMHTIAVFHDHHQLLDIQLPVVAVVTG